MMYSTSRYDTTGYVRFVFTTWHINDPHSLTINIYVINFTFQYRRNLTNRILNSRTLIVVNLGPNNLIVIVNSYEYVSASRICKTRNLIRNFLYLRGHTALEVYIVAFASFYKF